MPPLRELDELPAGQAATLFGSCCGSRRWVEEMVARRPFHSRDALLSVAREVWRSLGPADWKAAFAAHPRIGERSAAPAQSTLGRRWSEAEQAGMDSAEAVLRRELAEVNRLYEARFGYLYIVCATGKTAEELLALARRRLANDPDTELAVAAAEQEQVTRIRLEKLIADG